MAAVVDEGSCPGAVIHVVAPRTATVRAEAVECRRAPLAQDRGRPRRRAVAAGARPRWGWGAGSPARRDRSTSSGTLGEHRERGGIDDEHGAGCDEGRHLRQRVEPARSGSHASGADHHARRRARCWRPGSARRWRPAGSGSADTRSSGMRDRHRRRRRRVGDHVGATGARPQRGDRGEHHATRGLRVAADDHDACRGRPCRRLVDEVGQRVLGQHGGVDRSGALGVSVVHAARPVRRSPAPRRARG